MAQPPAGTVTFLFTDIEGSTRLWESATDSMRLALERHDSILRSVIEDNLGYVFATGGDGFAVAFSRVGEALATAEAAQAMFRAESWPEGVEIRVRMAVHTGEAAERDWGLLRPRSQPDGPIDGNGARRPGRVFRRDGEPGRSERSLAKPR